MCFSRFGLLRLWCAAFLLALSSLLAGCGDYSSDQSQPPAPTPTPTPKPGGEDPGDTVTYAAMQKNLVTYCQSCHASANFMTSEAALRASSVQTRLTNRSMPPSNAPKALPDNVRTQMLSFF